MNSKDTDARLELNVGDFVKFEVDLQKVLMQGVSLRHSGESGGNIEGGPEVSFTGRVDYYTRNGDEVNTLNEMVADIHVTIADDQPIVSLGSGKFKNTTRPQELVVILELGLDQRFARDIKDQILRVPEAQCVFEGEVISPATPHLPCFFKVTQFWIGVN